MQAIIHGSDDPETIRILTFADPENIVMVRRLVRRLRGRKVSIFADGP